MKGIGPIDPVPSYGTEAGGQGSVAGGMGTAGTPEEAAIRTARSTAAISPQGRLVHRAPATLRPHSAYLELGGPISATRVAWISRQPEALCEPLLITVDGTILDGHVRWQVAIRQQLSSLPCLEYDVTEEEALKTVIARHSRVDGLNAFCRIALALRLEPHFTAAIPRHRSTAGPSARSSTLTTAGHHDVRRDIARAAGVSTGNVTKVKQILKSGIPEVRESLQRGELRIHRAWGWRHLPPAQQRDVLWQHRHRKDIHHTIRRLITHHTEPQRGAQATDQASDILKWLTAHASQDIPVIVANIPGRALVITRELYNAVQGVSS
jgi:hypothetical protein